MEKKVHVSLYHLSELLKQLLKHSHRMPGSYECFEVAAFIEELLQDYFRIGRLNVHEQEVESWTCVNSDLVSLDDYGTIDHVPALFSQSGSCMARCVLLDPFNLDIKRLENKVALICGVKTFKRIAKTLSKTNVLGVLVASTYPCLPEVTFSYGLKVPVISIPLREADELRSGKSILINLETNFYKSRVKEFEYEIPGKSEYEILLYAHYDSLMYSPGAQDDAAGVAVVLELLRIFEKSFLAPNCTLKILLSGTGILGHKFLHEYVRKHANRILLVVAVDYLGGVHSKPLLCVSLRNHDILRKIKSLHLPIQSTKLKTFNCNFILVTQTPRLFRGTTYDSSSVLSKYFLKLVVERLYRLISEIALKQGM